MNYDTRGQKMLIADSDRTVLEMLQIRLDVAGYHTCAARTGPMVLELLQNFRPAVLVLDLNLPELDGFGVLETLTQRCNRLPVPTLVMGKALAAEDIQRAIQLGARDCMAKPFSGAHALERVARLLRKPTPPQRPVHYVDAVR